MTHSPAAPAFLSRSYLASFPGAVSAGDQSALTSASPAVTLAQAEDHARAHFGISGQVKALTSERDANFRLTTADGANFLLKISNDLEDPAITGMQTETLAHLAAVAPDLPVQRVFLTRDGSPHQTISGSDGRQHILRLVSYLDGTMLSQAEPEAGFYDDLGRCMGQLNRALRGFYHPMAGHALPWDIKNAESLWPYFPCIEDAKLRGQVECLLQDFRSRIKDRLAGMRAQVVHNDFNPYNLVVDGPQAKRVTGIIDFGDMVHTPLVCDLAVACSYNLPDSAGGFEKITRIVSAYHRELPLEDEEIGLLPDLIALRNVATVSITAWRAARFPENRDYILRNVPNSLRSLKLITETGSEAMAALIRGALQSGNGGILK